MSSLAMKLPFCCVLTFLLGTPTPWRLMAADSWSAHVISEVSSEDGTIEAFAVGDFNADRHSDLAALLSRPDGTAVLRVFIHPGPANAATRWPSVDVARFEAATQSRIPGDVVIASLDGGPVSQIITNRASVQQPLVVHHPPREAANVLRPEAWRNVEIPVNATLLTNPDDRPPSPLRLAAAALDDRPGQELVVASAPSANGASAGALGWLEQPSTANASWKFHPLAPYGTTRPIVVADLTRDGAADLLWIHSGPADTELPNPGIHWLTNPGVGRVHQPEAWLHTQIGPDQTNLTQLAIGDLGDDGFLDVAAATDAHRVPLYIQHAPRPPGWKPYPIPAPSKAPLGTAVALVDLNNDGQTDLIHATAEPDSADADRAGPAAITCYEQIRIDAIPAWVAQPIAQSETGRYLQLHPTDINQDEVPDLLTLLKTGGGSQLLWLTR